MFAVLFLAAIVVATRNTDFGCGSGQIIDGVCLPDGYSRLHRPSTAEADVIKVSLDIADILEIDDRQNTVTFETYFNLEWQEKRLNVTPELGASGTFVPVNVELVKELWLPNIYIYNMKSFRTLEVLAPMSGLWIKRDKAVLYSQAVIITFFCPMKLGRFPFDSQTCRFRAGSYSYDSSKLLFLTERAGYSRPRTLEESQEVPMDYTVAIEPLAPNSQREYKEYGNFSLAGFELVLNRHKASYIAAYYLPSGVVVVLSWSSFLLPPASCRPVLLTLLLLLLTTISLSAAENTPKARVEGGLTALQAWVMACLAFVFAAFVEMIAVLQLQLSKPDCTKLDHHSLKAFPVVFLVFNIIYWTALVI